MKNIELIKDVYLEIPNGPLGVLVSGGADSAILLYHLLQNTDSTLHIFSIANADKMFTTAKTCIEVIGKCAELTNNFNFIQHTRYVTLQDKTNLFETAHSYIQNGTINYLYTGVTKNPPDEVVATFNIVTTENNERNPNFIRPTKVGTSYYPWTNIDKKDIHALYAKYNLLETLFPLTRSCEWRYPMGKVKDPGTGHCGECWWCKERAWGFGKL